MHSLGKCLSVSPRVFLETFVFVRARSAPAWQGWQGPTLSPCGRAWPLGNLSPTASGAVALHRPGMCFGVPARVFPGIFFSPARPSFSPARTVVARLAGPGQGPALSPSGQPCLWKTCHRLLCAPKHCTGQACALAFARAFVTEPSFSPARSVGASLGGPGPASVWSGPAFGKLVTDCFGRLGIAQLGCALGRSRAPFSDFLSRVIGRARPSSLGVGPCRRETRHRLPWVPWLRTAKTSAWAFPRAFPPEPWLAPDRTVGASLAGPGRVFA